MRAPRPHLGGSAGALRSLRASTLRESGVALPCCRLLPRRPLRPSARYLPRRDISLPFRAAVCTHGSPSSNPNATDLAATPETRLKRLARTGEPLGRDMELPLRVAFCPHGDTCVIANAIMERHHIVTRPAKHFLPGRAASDPVPQNTFLRGAVLNSICIYIHMEFNTAPRKKVFCGTGSDAARPGKKCFAGRVTIWCRSMMAFAITQVSPCGQNATRRGNSMSRPRGSPVLARRFRRVSGVAARSVALGLEEGLPWVQTAARKGNEMSRRGR